MWLIKQWCEKSMAAPKITLFFMQRSDLFSVTIVKYWQKIDLIKA